MRLLFRWRIFWGLLALRDLPFLSLELEAHCLFFFVFKGERSFRATFLEATGRFRKDGEQGNYAAGVRYVRPDEARMDVTVGGKSK